MKRIGVTGSIGMGKTTTAQFFADTGLPVYDADAAVHELYAAGGAAVAPVAAAFPGVARAGAIDRAVLSKAVLGDTDAIKRLEAIVHPLTALARERFIADAAKKGAPAVVFDIPLLFETGGEGFMDAVIVASAPYETQKKRVLARADMTEEKLAAILARQVSDADKRKRADYIVDTSRGLDDARAQVADIMKKLGIPTNA